MQVQITGVENKFLDNTQDMKESTAEPGPVTFSGEVDRIYVKTPSTLQARGCPLYLAVCIASQQVNAPLCASLRHAVMQQKYPAASTFVLAHALSRLKSARGHAAA